MYAREIEGREFHFGVSGKLIRNVLVMYDQETESYWSQLIGEAVAGPLQGQKLTFLPSWMTTWEQWQTLHPTTLALDKLGAGSRDIYDLNGYYASPYAGVIDETIIDDRLHTKEFVVGVELPDAAIAYPFTILSQQPVVNDSAAGRAILIVFNPNEASGVAYDRVVHDQTLTFAAGSAWPMLTDTETGSIWDAFSGIATAGPLAGEQLTRLKSTTVFWFGWKDFHPDTLLYAIEN